MARSKGLSWFVTNSLGFRNTRMVATERQAPPRGLDTVLRSLRRRLDDRVSDVFHAACVSGDLVAAEKLLNVLEDLHARRRQRYANDRRHIDDEPVRRARHELERCRTAKTVIAL
jgi:hypothetical protein